MTTTPEKQPNNCKKRIHADGMCYCLEDKPTPEAEGIEERRKFIEVFYKDFNDYNDIDVKFEDVYQYHHHQLQKAREEEKERIEAIFKEHVPPHAMDLEDSVWLKRLLNKAFGHD